MAHLDSHFLPGILHLFPMIDQEHPLFPPFPQEIFGSKFKVTLNGPDCGLSNRTFTYLHLSFLQSCEGDTEGKWSEHPEHWLFIVSIESFKWGKRLRTIWGMVIKCSCWVWKERIAKIMGKWLWGWEVGWMVVELFHGREIKLFLWNPKDGPKTIRLDLQSVNFKWWSEVIVVLSEAWGHGITWAFKQRRWRGHSKLRCVDGLVC